MHKYAENASHVTAATLGPFGALVEWGQREIEVLGENKYPSATLFTLNYKTESGTWGENPPTIYP
jgi:hypothetical protein